MLIKIPLTNLYTDLFMILPITIMMFIFAHFKSNDYLEKDLILETENITKTENKEILAKLDFIIEKLNN